ncbi:MAG TPA: beta-ketoacyl-[acyl-carrier-protein] synthase family protein [Noviherbaspirillum sp.]
MKPLFLSRPGILSALGNGAEQTFSRLIAGHTQGMRVEEGWLANAPARVGKVIAELPPIPKALEQHDSRNNRLLLAAFAQIRDDFALAVSRYGSNRIGIILGTSTSGIAEGEAAIAHHERNGSLPAGFAYEQMDIGNPAVFLASHLGIHGPAYTVSTACSSGNKAMISARNLIRAGMCDAVLTGAVDSLCRLTIGGFTALESTTPDLCQPLSRNRRGINIGEGAALFILSGQESPVAFVGAGESSDACHISAPEPSGRGAENAMRAALHDARLSAADIGYLNLHATATIKNDAMESIAVDRVFPDGVPVSGTKPMTGHALGAAGAIEAALCWLSLTDPEGRLPPHVWDGQSDHALPVLNVVTPGQRFAGSRRFAMSNSFAFGGNNASLIFGAQG